jgi:hypothetical protein
MINATITSGAREALDRYDAFMAGQDLSPFDKVAADRVARAACFAAEAYKQTGPDEESGVHALARAFLLAMVDPLDEQLDYLRADPASGQKAREGAA